MSNAAIAISRVHPDIRIIRKGQPTGQPGRTFVSRLEDERDISESLQSISTQPDNSTTVTTATHSLSSQLASHNSASLSMSTTNSPAAVTSHITVQTVAPTSSNHDHAHATKDLSRFPFPGAIPPSEQEEEEERRRKRPEIELPSARGDLLSPSTTTPSHIVVQVSPSVAHTDPHARHTQIIDDSPPMSHGPRLTVVDERGGAVSPDQYYEEEPSANGEVEESYTAEDDSFSEEFSDRENRAIIFADEVGRDLVHVWYYDVDFPDEPDLEAGTDHEGTAAAEAHHEDASITCGSWVIPADRAAKLKRIALGGSVLIILIVVVAVLATSL